MLIPWRDRIATLLVATAVIVYLLWLIGPLASIETSSVAVVILVLGFIASASAVVPGFDALLAGSKAYLALASLGGLVALACGALTVTQGTEQTLAILVVMTTGLWAAATVRHTVIHRPATVGMH